MGYHQAGFDEIVGVDVEPQPNFPFEFVQADALDWDTWDFDLIHASPPCQALTTMGNRWKNPKWPNLILPTRTLIKASGLPFVLENVLGATKHLKEPIKLTGEMFDLPVHRPRLFELGGWTATPPSRGKRRRSLVGVYGKPDGRRLWTRKDGSELRAWASIEEGQRALGVPWMNHAVEIAESIPPVYTKYIGTQFLSRGGGGWMTVSHPPPTESREETRWGQE